MKEDYEEISGVAVKAAISFFITIWLLVLMCLMCGCSRTHYVPVETVRTEYVDRVNVERVVDSVTNDRFVYVKGDTLIDIRWRDRWHTREVHDTVVSVRTDSVAVPYPVERELSRWERVKMDFGGIAVGAALAVIAWLAVWLVKSKR